MQTILKTNKYISKNKDHYTISSLIVNDDLYVNLDMPLSVLNDLFVAGNLKADNDISIEGRTLINGTFSGKSLASKKGIVIRQNSLVSGSLRSDNHITVEGLRISSDIVTNKSFVASGQVDSKGNMAAGETIVLSKFSSFKGSIVAGLMIDAKESFSCGGKVKIGGMIVNTYARICVSDAVFIKTGEILNGYHRGKKFDTIPDFSEDIKRRISKKEPSSLDKLFVIGMTPLLNSEMAIVSPMDGED